MDSDENSKKRKRVTRACDECRKKKVKCDGQQPCIHCTVYSYDCTYDKPSSRRKIVDASHLESKLKQSEHLLSILLPGTDIYDPSFDLSATLEHLASTPGSTSGSGGESNSPAHVVSKLALSRRNSRLASLTIDNSGSSYYPSINDSPLFASPSSVEDSPEFKIILPPKHVAGELIEAVWSNACVLFRFYHRPQFIRDVDLLYDVDPENYTDKEFKILPLVYSVMAVGILFSTDKLSKLGIKDASEGYKFFVAARRLIDITDARDLYAIKSIVMMIMFLQCSARLSTCYSYIGIALRSALRTGLHRKVNHNFDPVELETRKRLFWTIRKMDIYVNAILGLPRTIDEEEFDQDLPIELDDENITEDGYFEQKEGKLSSVGISNAHTRLMNILHHIMKSIYPIRPLDGPTHIFNVTYNKIEEMEKEIVQWHESLPVELRPGANVAPEYFKANRLLSLAYCHLQIVLYRPFIHYCSGKFLTTNFSDDRPKLYARKCVNVARRVMYLANDLVSKNMLNGAYWYAIYTIFFSVSCLVYYIHENANDHDTYGIRLDAEMGKNALKQLKSSSVTAERTHNILNMLFDQLNKSTAKLPENHPGLGRVSFPEAAGYNANDSLKPSDGNGIIKDTDNDNIQAFDPNLDPRTLLDGVQTEPTFRRTSKSAKSKANNGSTISNNGNGNGGSEGFTNIMDGLNGNFGDGLLDDLNVAGDFGSSTTQDGQDATAPLATFDANSYMPGMMDQLDTQIFGRFLPPYMMSSSSNSNNESSQSQPQPEATAAQAATIPDSLDGLADGQTGNQAATDPEFGFYPNVTTSTSATAANDVGNNKIWGDFLDEHVELSGMNSFMNF